MPPIWLGTSEAIAELGDLIPHGLRISVMDTHPRSVEGQIRILAGYADQGRAAARWAQRTGAGILLIGDASSSRGTAVANAFCGILPDVPVEQVESGKHAELAARIVSHAPGLVFYSGEDAPYGTSESIFKELRAKGFAGKLVMAEADPEVSFLAVPCRVPEGTFLISPIGPPSPEFTAKYEPATGRHAGPHGWVGYLAMKRTLELLEGMDSGKREEFDRVAASRPPVPPSCALYLVRNGKFEFVQALK
jgi:hypothetical protein